MKEPSLTSTKAAIVPRTVAMVAETSATLSVTHAASINASLFRTSPYHLVENPPQTVTSLLSLKLKITRMRIGR